MENVNDAWNELRLLKQKEKIIEIIKARAIQFDYKKHPYVKAILEDIEEMSVNQNKKEG